MTDDFTLADDDRNEMLSVKHNIIEHHIDEQPDVQFTYFIPDERKAGGSFVTVKGNVRRIDDYSKVFILTDSQTEMFVYRKYTVFRKDKQDSRTEKS